ncbi:MAG TPA: hypothetical protein VFI46_08090 [Jiangellaceae bacterium]|nr:hypothetical protein [Jiangellaceae bacterium]
MSAADTMRRAAALMRERAATATPIASWHPAIAQAVADWLEVTAEDIETCAAAGYDIEHLQAPHQFGVDVALVYLRGRL